MIHKNPIVRLAALAWAFVWAPSALYGQELAYPPPQPGNAAGIPAPASYAGPPPVPGNVASPMPMPAVPYGPPASVVPYGSMPAGPGSMTQVVPGECYPAGGWIIGAGGYFLQPRWGNNPAYDIVSSTFDGFQETDVNSQEDFDAKLHFAPLVWLGYVGPQGIGVRTRYWQLRASSGVSVNQPIEDGDTESTVYSAYPLGIGFASVGSADFASTFHFDSTLGMDVSDTEILWDFHPGRGSILLGAGVRYARLTQDYNASWVSTPTDPTQDTLETVLGSHRTFSGLGPLVSVEARYPIGVTGFSLTGALRGAILFGTGQQQVAETTWESDSSGALVSQNDISKSRSTGGTMPVLEFELGAQWERRFGRYRFLAETALVGQAWFYAGNAANQQNIFGSVLPYDCKDFQDTLGLVGLRLNLGLTY